MTYEPMIPEDAIALLERRHDGLVHGIAKLRGSRDWTRPAAERFLWNAASIRWEEHYSGHNLRVVAPDGRIVRFMTEPRMGPEDAAVLRDQPFTPDPLGELRRVAAEEGVDLHGLPPGDGLWVVRVNGSRIVEWTEQIEETQSPLEP
jgi:hypothetical protein